MQTLFPKYTLINLIIAMLVISCGKFFERDANANIHRSVEDDRVSVEWVKDNIIIFSNQNTPAILSANNRIIALGIQPHNLYALEAKTGNTAWSLDVREIYPDAMGINNDILFTSNLNVIRAFNTDTGEEILESRTAYVGKFLYMNFYEQKVFLYSSNGTFLTLNTSGETLDITKPNYFPVPLFIDGAILIAGTDFDIESYNTITNEKLWEANVPPPYYTNPIIIKDSIYIRAGSAVIPGGVYAIDKNTGIIDWKSDLNAISNICILEERLYVLVQEGDLLGLSLVDGSIQERIHFLPGSFTLPTSEWRIGGYYVTCDPDNNILVVSTGDSYQLFAFKIIKH